MIGKKYFVFVVRLFILGMLIIGGAIFLNVIAEIFNLYTWYDLFLQNDLAINNFGIINLIFIFLIYPTFLGTIAYYSILVIKKIKK